ncbi:MAG: hypothetical protein OES24_11530 [Acidimicrobiia bacterium]|nr:hypothetical protein [Acidimicrobiia bacterium]
MSGSDGLPAVEAAVHDDVVHGAVDLDVITVSGSDAEEYLQGQLSQNVAALAIGETRWTLLLQPQGKVDAWMRLHRVDPDRLWLIVDAGFGDGALARLERFKLRVDVTMNLDRRTAVALRGPGSRNATEQIDSTDGLTPVDAGWGPVPGVDLVPEGGELPDTARNHRFGPAANAEAMELIRVLQGRPLMGRELDASTIPAAAGVVDQSVDFSKGCYVGQELVARIDSRGSNTPTRLVRLIGPAVSPPAPGSKLLVDGSEAGTVTSVSLSPSQGLVGLGYVKRAVVVPGGAEIESADGTTVVVDLLPLLPSLPSDLA